MSSLVPIAVFGLEVPAGDVMVPAHITFPATFRLTMAAIDPSATPKLTGTANGDVALRATLKIVYEPVDPNENSDEGNDDIQGLLQDQKDSEDDEEEASSSDEEKKGGPSDASKSKKALQQAAVEHMMKVLAEDKSDDEMVHNASETNGAVSKVSKGKGKATKDDGKNSEGEDEDVEEDDDDNEGLEELVLCTLDPLKNYQQTLDLTVGEDQRAFFKVSGTHAVYLTGNYVISAGNNYDHPYGEEAEADYDLSPDEEEMYDEDESDALDDIEDPRIIEIESEDDDLKLASKEEPVKKGRKKRVAEESLEETANLDDIMAKSLKSEEAARNDESKLSKKQRKKLKNNAGAGVKAMPENKDVKRNDQTVNGSPEKCDKKVQFAKNLEQGPSNTKKDSKIDSKTSVKAEANPEWQKEVDKQKGGLGTRIVQGVKIEDKKLGKGPAATKGDRVGMRYIGKLQDGKIFDANKKGTPFTFKLGTGDVIKGWDIGVAGMSVGGERRIIVPAPLAYGSKSLPKIPANSQLTFDVKLLEIK